MTDYRQPYVYRLIDLETGKRYIGSRYARGCRPEDLGVKYFTSSKAVKPLFKADPGRFEKQIIVVGEMNYVRNVERSLLKMYDAVISDEYYNRHDTEIGHPEDCALGGKAAVESGQLASLRTREHQKKAGSAGGKKVASLGLLKKVASLGGVAGGFSNTLSGHISNLGKAHGSVNGKKAMSLRYACAVCGMVSVPAGIGRHQKFSGHSGVNK